MVRLENEKLSLEQMLKDLEGKLEEQGQTFQAQVLLLNISFLNPRLTSSLLQMSSKDGEIRLLLKEIKEGGFDMVLAKHVYGVSGKQKYEQLVEVKLSLEMEIQTYRSILEDEEKRIKRFLTFDQLKVDHMGQN